MLVVGGQQLVAQPDPAAEVHAPRHVGDEVVGPAFDQKAVLRNVSRTPPSRPAASRSVISTVRASSVRRWAAASPEIPPPITATRFGKSAESVMLAAAGRSRSKGGKWNGTSHLGRLAKYSSESGLQWRVRSFKRQAFAAGFELPVACMPLTRRTRFLGLNDADHRTAARRRAVPEYRNPKRKRGNGQIPFPRLRFGLPQDAKVTLSNQTPDCCDPAGLAQWVIPAKLISQAVADGTSSFNEDPTATACGDGVELPEPSPLAPG